MHLKLRSKRPLWQSLIRYTKVPTIDCKECSNDVPCGSGHLYVLELGLGIEDHFKNQPANGYVYVGSTRKTVEERFQDNLTRSDGTVVSIHEAKDMPEDGHWKYVTSGTKKIRKHYVEHRPDLFYRDYNPIILDNGDPDRLKRREKKLARKLRNRGYRVLGDV